MQQSQRIAVGIGAALMLAAAGPVGGHPAVGQEAAGQDVGARERPVPSAGGLVGLRTASRDFGPHVRGPVELVLTPSGLRVDIAGYDDLAVATSANLLRLVVSGGRGEFRGRSTCAPSSRTTSTRSRSGSSPRWSR